MRLVNSESNISNGYLLHKVTIPWTESHRTLLVAESTTDTGNESMEVPKSELKYQLAKARK